jgi:hypothetical protein
LNSPDKLQENNLNAKQFLPRKTCGGVVVEEGQGKRGNEARLISANVLQAVV